MDCSTCYRFGAPKESVAGADAPAPVERASLSGRKTMSVTIHDVAPATQARCEQLIARIEGAGRLPLTLLIVPRFHHQRPTPEFERWIEMRVRQGDELALHGLTHLDETAPLRGWVDRVRRRWYTAGEGEFAAIGQAAARDRLEAGRRWFTRRGWPVRGFVAPAWLLGAGAWSALREQPFEYTCTLNRLIALPRGANAMLVLNGWSVVFSTRAAWRRRTSLAWNGLLMQRLRNAQWMRFELHPGDADHASVFGALNKWIERARTADREPLTLGALADRMR
jgi:uncharacterized protein